MPRKEPKLVVAEDGAAEARRIVADQRELIERLKASGLPTLDAERALQSYTSALKHLEDHALSVRMPARANRRAIERPERN